jgi:hypothetical protein
MEENTQRLQSNKNYSRKGPIAMGSKTAQATTTTNTSPWSGQQPYLTDQFKAAKNLYDTNTPSYFPNSTVAGFSPEQQQAQTLGAQRATQGNEGMKYAQNYNNDQLQGKYLNSNPYQDAVYGNISQKVLPSVNSQFSNSGRYGSGLHADTETRALTEAYAPYASQQYDQGIQNMNAAANRAPTFAANDYTDISALNDIGQQKQGLAQNELQDAMNRFNYNRDFNANNLAQYAGFTGGNYGSQGTSSVPYQKPSIWSQIAGGTLGLGGLLG